MQTEHALRPRRRGGDDIRVEIAGVGGQDRIGPHDAVQLLEKAGLDGEIVEHGLDDEVGIGDVPGVRRDREPVEPRGAAICVETPRCHCAIEKPDNPVAPFGRRFSGLLDADHAIAGVERRYRDARAHQPGSDHADRPDRPWRDALQPRHLGRGALGKEDVAQSLGLVGIAQPEER